MMPSVGAFKRMAFTIGACFFLASLPISFWNPTSAGFFLAVGLLVIAYGSLSLNDVKSFTLSASSVSAEFREQVDRAEDVLALLRAAEDRIFVVLSEQMLNKGGEHYLGGSGDEAEINIVEELEKSGVAQRNALMAENMAELKRRVGLTMLYAILGDPPGARSDAIASYFRANPVRLPSRSEIVSIAEADGRDINGLNYVMDAYEAFAARGDYPSQDLRKQLYALKTRHRTANSD